MHPSIEDSYSGEDEQRGRTRNRVDIHPRPHERSIPRQQRPTHVFELKCNSQAESALLLIDPTVPIRLAISSKSSFLTQPFSDAIYHAPLTERVIYATPRSLINFKIVGGVEVVDKVYYGTAEDSSDLLSRIDYARRSISISALWRQSITACTVIRSVGEFC